MTGILVVETLAKLNRRYWCAWHRWGIHHQCLLNEILFFFFLSFLLLFSFLPLFVGPLGLFSSLIISHRVISSIAWNKVMYFPSIVNVFKIYLNISFWVIFMNFDIWEYWQMFHLGFLECCLPCCLVSFYVSSSAESFHGHFCIARATEKIKNL